MKILCNYTPAGPSFVRSGWGRVFEALGHEFRFWPCDQRPAFDVFSEFEPDLYIGTTYETDRAVAKNIAMRPHMKVALYGSAWGKYVADIDTTKYPVVVTTEQEKRAIERLKKETGKPDFVFIHAHGHWLEGTMGGWREIGVEPRPLLNAADTFVYTKARFRPELACDVGFVGGYWPYKARNLDRFMLPLCHPSSGLDVKVFGNQPWPVHNYLGACADDAARDLFVSATVCPNVSEPHSTDLGWDIVERPFKVLAAGGFCVSDYVQELADLFSPNNEIPMAKTPQEFERRVRYFVENPASRNAWMEAGQRKVLTEHTYFDRVCDFFEYLGLESERAKCLKVKAQHLQGLL